MRAWRLHTLPGEQKAVGEPQQVQYREHVRIDIQRSGRVDYERRDPQLQLSARRATRVNIQQLNEESQRHRWQRVVTRWKWVSWHARHSRCCDVGVETLSGIQSTLPRARSCEAAQ